jgi:hypothetical protein
MMIWYFEEMVAVYIGYVSLSNKISKAILSRLISYHALASGLHAYPIHLDDIFPADVDSAQEGDVSNHAPIVSLQIKRPSGGKVFLFKRLYLVWKQSQLFNETIITLIFCRKRYVECHSGCCS